MLADPCPNCGSHDLLADVPVMQHNGTAGISVVLYAPPIELLGVPLWQGTQTLPLHARICTACGHTALFVADPSAILQFADQRPVHASTEPSLRRPTGQAACPHCTMDVPDGANFCPTCGSTLAAAATGPTTRLATAPRRPSTMPLTRQCPDCHGAMERGFIPAELHNQTRQLLWIHGESDRSRWTGDVHTHDQRAWHIVVYRCDSCGLLAPYTAEEV